MGRATIFDPISLREKIFSRPLQFLISLFYRLFNRLQSKPRPKHPSIQVVCISDTHTRTQSIPDGDILIHAGDLTNEGTIDEIQEQIDWLDSLPHTHKIAIAGNHDTFLDPKSRQTLSAEDQKGGLDWKSIHYLQHSSMTIVFEGPEKRRFKVYGAPQIPLCGGSNFAFQYPRGMDAWTDTIPTDTDILITHTPPKYHLDLFSPSLGCEHLLREVWKIKPQLHVFGHIHVGAGRETIRWDEAQALYERVLAREGILGFFRQVLSVKLWIELIYTLFYGASNLVWNRVWGGGQSTILVNAALMFNNSGRLGNPVQIVEL